MCDTLKIGTDNDSVKDLALGPALWSQITGEGLNIVFILRALGANPVKSLGSDFKDRPHG